LVRERERERERAGRVRCDEVGVGVRGGKHHPSSPVVSPLLPLRSSPPPLLIHVYMYTYMYTYVT
jgi:hypothetical protein